MTLYTIGFAQKSAREFFGILQRAAIKQLVDVRLNNRSQLAGFTKREDLVYFLSELCQAEYRHELLLAPSKELLNGYKNGEISWPEYVSRFLALLDERKLDHVMENLIHPAPTVLLCSEPKPDKCHRRLVAEHLQSRHRGIEIIHL